VTNFLNPTVTVIDTTTNTVIGSPINVTDGSSRIEYDPVNKRMYVANFSGRTVSVINVR
jgi:DNA-binding beta-propeller fold protein YncE